MSSWSVPADLNGPEQASRAPSPTHPACGPRSPFQLSPGAPVSSPAAALPGNGPIGPDPNPQGGFLA